MHESEKLRLKRFARLVGANNLGRTHKYLNRHNVGFFLGDKLVNFVYVIVG